MQETTTNTIGEIIEPSPIAFSFEAPGWQLLIAVVMLLLLLYCIRLFINYRKNKYRRVALKNLQAIMESTSTDGHKIFKIMETLKRVAFISYGRKEQSHLYGRAWFEFLAQQNKGKGLYSLKTEEAVIQALYKRGKKDLPPADMDTMLMESINWIKAHHV